MQIQVTTDRARDRLEPQMRARATEWEFTSNDVISTAAARGLVTSPSTHQQIAAMILEEMRLRGVLCVEAAVAALDSANEERVAPTRGELIEIAATLLGECSGGLLRMRAGFAGLSHGEGMPSAEQCLLEGQRAIAERIDEILAPPAE